MAIESDISDILQNDIGNNTDLYVRGKDGYSFANRQPQALANAAAEPRQGRGELGIAPDGDRCIHAHVHVHVHIHIPIHMHKHISCRQIFTHIHTLIYI